MPLCALRLVRESGVIDRADDAAPSRAWPRLNASTRSRTRLLSTGQRRITARVMRSFGRRLPHTLPFPAHPRVASRPKSPARALATLFGLPATLRAGTESVLFPWRCSRRFRRYGLCRRRRKTLRGTQSGLSALAGEPPATRPVPLCRPLQASGGRAVLRPARPSSASSGRHSPLPPIAVTASAYAHAAPAPALRAASVAPTKSARRIKGVSPIK